jgi:hypothetical protein
LVLFFKKELLPSFFCAEAPASACNAPRGSGPYEHLQRPISDPAAAMPPPALAGYGFGDAGLGKLNGLRWAPIDDFAWHYLVINEFPRS